MESTGIESTVMQLAPAISGLVGVVVGSLLTIAKEWLFQRKKNEKDAEYLSILVSCELEHYAARCAEVVGDDGLCYGQTDKDGCHSRQVEEPKFNPHAFNVEWKSLPATLMYEILDFPYKGELADEIISVVFDYQSGPPDYSEGFEERQLQYACLGLAALGLATKLRRYAKLPPRDIGEWNPGEDMEKRRADIEARRELRGVQSGA